MFIMFPISHIHLQLLIANALNKCVVTGQDTVPNSYARGAAFVFASLRPATRDDPLDRRSPLANGAKGNEYIAI